MGNMRPLTCSEDYLHIRFFYNCANHHRLAKNRLSGHKLYWQSNTMWLIPAYVSCFFCWIVCFFFSSKEWNLKIWAIFKFYFWLHGTIQNFKCLNLMMKKLLNLIEILCKWFLKLMVHINNFRRLQSLLFLHNSSNGNLSLWHLRRNWKQ